MTLNVYIDGFNLYKGALTPNDGVKWLDLKKFAQLQHPEAKLQDIFYFTARLKNLFPGDTSNERQHTYLRALEDSGIKIIEGFFDVRSRWEQIHGRALKEFTDPRLANPLGATQVSLRRIWKISEPKRPEVQVLIRREKGSDVNLASYMLKDLFNGKCDHFLVVTGDSDLITPMKIVEEQGAKLSILVPGRQENNSFRKLSGIFRDTKLTSIEDIQKSQFTNPYVCANGRQIHRPKSWT